MNYASCQDCANVADRYITEAVTSDERVAIAHHLLACQPCRDYLESYENTVYIVQSLGRRPEFTMGKELVPESLIEAILAKRAE